MKRKGKYFLRGEITRIEDNYFILTDKPGSKYRIYVQESLHKNITNKGLGFYVGVECRNDNSGNRHGLRCVSAGAVTLVKQRRQKRMVALTEMRTLQQEAPTVVKGKDNYNGAIPAVRNRKVKKSVAREKEKKTGRGWTTISAENTHYRIALYTETAADISRREAIEQYEQRRAYVKWKARQETEVVP